MEGVERKLSAILSADAVGYSRLVAENEVTTVRRLTAYLEEMSVLVRQHEGRVVDAPGDNMLAEFPSALQAASCAVEIQRVLQARNADLPRDRKLEFRIGVHLGDVMVEGEQIYGDGVNIAARIEGLAEPGGISVSAAIHEQVRHKLDLRFVDQGAQRVKNIPEPVRVYRVRAAAGAGGPKWPVGARRRRSRSAVVATVAVGLGLAIARG
ncbi:MAG: adenylate/guanylate cyclase domain-containing protein, partial [Acidobacteriota bacterium]|nr:adenylate/guanylate cyclase domain-containing protein [Acidobacteriota bacterium]